MQQEPPGGVVAESYSALRDAFNELAPRSRVVLVLRLGIWGREPLTLQAIGAVVDLGPERVRQLQNRAIADLCAAWRHRADRRLSPEKRLELLAPIIDSAVDRYPLD